MTETVNVGPVVVGYTRNADDGWEALVLVTGDGDTLELQAVLPGREDEFGDERHCVVVAAGPTAYGAVERWATGPGFLDLRLTDAGQRVLGLPRDTRCEIDPDGAQLLDEHLSRILGHTPLQT